MNYKRKACCFLASFFCFIHLVFGQDQKVADNLVLIYKADTATGKAKLELLLDLAFNERNNLNLSLRYAEELITLAKQEDSSYYVYSGYFQKGLTKRLLGNLDEALDAYFKSAAVARKASLIKGEGNAYGAIADIYSVSNNHNNAMLYYNKAITTLRQSNDFIGLATAILNAGDEYLNNKNYDSALTYFKEAKSIFDKVNYPAGKAYTLGDIGMVYANTGEIKLAESNLNEAIQILEKSGDYYPICVYLIAMSDIYTGKNDRHTAMQYAMRSLALAQHYGLKEQIADANLKVSQLHEKAGNTGESFKYYKSYIVYRDSLNNIRSIQKMADLRTDYEVSRKQIQVDLLNEQKRNQQTMVISLYIILGLTTIILGTLYWYYRVIARQKKISESLLLNILPGETAAELKRNGKVAATRFNLVTVLFTDFVEFTKAAEHMAPEQLVQSIDFYFRRFDEIGTRCGLEKIKTIGDSYMCACGIPTANHAHAKNVINAAKEMMDFVNNELHAEDGLCHFQIRIGIHTGPVVAGIVGIKKWQYDIWGDTVNIASRMESMSKPGRINLSETTYFEIKDEFACEYRGEIEVKNHGSIRMYFLS